MNRRALMAILCNILLTRLGTKNRNFEDMATPPLCRTGVQEFKKLNILLRKNFFYSGNKERVIVRAQVSG